jgi:hypothetical protein
VNLRVLLAALALLLVACGGGTSSADAGTVKFGAGLNRDELLVKVPKKTFALGDQIAWRAELSEPAGATSLTFTLAKREKSGSESVVYQQPVAVADPKFDVLANEGDLGITEPGTYVVRILRDATVLAEGEFAVF